MATIAQQVFSRLSALNEDEQLVALHVLDRVIARLEKGRVDYGPLNLASDQRDFAKEGDEEMLDGAIYGACRVLAPGRRMP